jgi:metallo-beta-lactamase family protein
MRLTTYGAARNVTGSKHMLAVGGRNILLDCGLFQGRRSESERRNRTMPFDPASIHAALLSHAHIDHSGSLPTLVKRGFGGPIYATAATVDLAGILLRDTAYIQRHDLEYLNKRRRRRGLLPLEPVYTEDDVERTLERFVPVEYDAPVRVAPGVVATFRDAGHILGSAIVEVDATELGRSKRIVFTGDLGRPDMPILRDPHQASRADVLITESTYGMRRHAEMANVETRLGRLITDVARRRGKIVIPSFAVGRTQRVLYVLHALSRNGDVPDVPVYVDSPLAVRATEIFRRHPECFDAEMNELLRERDDPLGESHATFITDVQDSKKLNRRKGPMVIISASGMCEAGRVLHHLKNTVTSRRNAVLIVGYQAEHTLGRRIAERRRQVRIFGTLYPLRARVEVIEELSSHADSDGLVAFAKGLRRFPERTVVVHGGPEQALGLASRLTDEGFPNVSVPVDGESYEL